jgi:hypothetical protein
MGQFLPVADGVKGNVAYSASGEAEVLACCGVALDELADCGQGVGDLGVGFVAGLGVVCSGCSVFNLDCNGGVEAYEAVLCEFSGAFNGFEEVGCAVLGLEFGEEFEGRLGEGDSFVVYGVG